MIKIYLRNDKFGSLKVTPDPRGADDFDQVLKRSEATDGVTYEYTLDFEFTSKARAFIQHVYENDKGIESLITCEVFEYMPNLWKYELIATTTLDLKTYDIGAETVKLNFDKIGVQSKTLNLMSTDFDIETLVTQGGLPLDPLATVYMPFHSRKIIKQSLAGPSDGNEFQQSGLAKIEVPGGGAGSVYRERLIYGNISTSKPVLDEYETIALDWGFTDSFTDNLGADDVPGTDGDYETYLRAHLDPRIEFKRVTKATEVGPFTYKNKLNLKHYIEALETGGDVDTDCPGGTSPGPLGKTEWTYWFEHRSEDNTIKHLEKIGAYDMPGCGDNPRENGFQLQAPFEYSGTLELGDKLYAYMVIRIYSSYDQPAIVDGEIDYALRVTPIVAPDDEDDDDTEPPAECTTPSEEIIDGDYTYSSLTVDTSYRETKAKTWLIYEALERMFQYYTDQRDCFRSDYFDRTDRGATVDGKGSKRVITGGDKLRKLCGKSTFVNGDDFYGSLNMIDCLGMGFEVLPDGTNIVRIEPLSYFYNKNDLILDLGSVSKLRKKVAVKQYCNLFVHGYPKLDIEQTNGLDEPNTSRTWKLPFTRIQQKETRITKYKTAGAEIEEQRRLQTTTEDSKNDDAKFIVDVTREGDSWRPTRDDDFTLVENLFDPPSAYNLNLSPRRNAENYKKFLAAMLFKSPDKVAAFASGEGNYEMITQKTGEAVPLAENSGIDVTGIEPDTSPEIYTFECPLDATQMKQIRAKPYGYFVFREFDGAPDLYGYLQKVSRSSKKKLGTFELIKVYKNG